ncbi:MAG: DnaD domain protein, partial [Clostridia bacterium]|nr:DnaD domain protein [Clostridia bacterium]
MKEKVYFVKEETVLSALPAVREATAEELRTLLALKESGKPLSAKEVASLCGLSEEECGDALSFFRGAGAVTLRRNEAQDGPQKPERGKKPVLSGDKLPDFSPEKAAEVIDRNHLASFITSCQEIYGKEFSPVDVGILVGLLEQLELSPEYVSILLAFCEERDRKPLKYVEKVAFSLFDRGITTVDGLTRYIETKHLHDSRFGYFRKLFGMGERALTAKEEAAMLHWVEEYGFSDEVVGLAYDITVNQTQKASVAYADKILSGWFAAGCHNVSDAQ